MHQRSAWKALRQTARTYYFLPQFVIQRSVELFHLRQLDYERPLLDLGCGDAAFTRLLFPDRGSVDYGLDPEPDQLERARQTGIFRELFHAPGDRIPLPNGSLQTVFSNSVFEHIPEIEPVLKESARVLARGGRLVFTTPTEHFPNYFFFVKRYRAWGLPAYADAYQRFADTVFAHTRYWTHEQWVGVLTAAGFDVERDETFVSPHSTELQDKWFVRQLALRTFSPALAKRVEGSFARSVSSPLRRVPRTAFEGFVGFALASYLWHAFFKAELRSHEPGSQRLVVARRA